MAIKVKAKIKGVKELEKALSELGKTFGDPKYAIQALRPAVRAAMKPLVSIVKRTTPFDHGTLSRSTQMKISKATNKDKKSIKFNKDSVIIGRVGWYWKSVSLWKQGLAVEFGTATNSANHTLINALENNYKEILKTFKSALLKSIDKKTKQLEKKFRRT